MPIEHWIEVKFKIFNVYFLSLTLYVDGSRSCWKTQFAEHFQHVTF